MCLFFYQNSLLGVLPGDPFVSRICGSKMIICPRLCNTPRGTNPTLSPRWKTSPMPSFSNLRHGNFTFSLNPICPMLRPLSDTLRMSRSGRTHLLVTPMPPFGHATITTWPSLGNCTSSGMQKAVWLAWIQSGDANTAFFHRVPLTHRRKNHIPMLTLPNNTMVQEPNAICSACLPQSVLPSLGVGTGAQSGPSRGAGPSHYLSLLFSGIGYEL